MNTRGRCGIRAGSKPFWNVELLDNRADYRVFGPCCCMKQHDVSIIKIDATQLLKAASLERGLARVVEMLDRIQKKNGI